MEYSQKPLIQAFVEGLFPEDAKGVRHIETVISNVFVGTTKAYKVYKHDNHFFNKNFRDLGSKESRFLFTQKDFVWNSTLSPSIYLELCGVRISNGKLEFVENLELAEELVIVMNSVNTDEILFDHLLRDTLSEEDAHSVGVQLAQQIQKVRSEKPMGNYYEIFASLIEDVRSWVKDIPEHKDELLEYCNFLDQHRIQNREWYEGELSDQLAYSGDMHSHNAHYANGTLSLMDTYAPKDSWLVAHELVPFYRLGADLWALGNKEMFEAYVRGYEEGSKSKVDQRLTIPGILYASSIMVAYLYMLVKANPAMKEVAERYHAFTRNLFKELKK